MVFGIKYLFVSRKKVAVGLSGGVDSAVSALLLKRQGYDVVGVHLYCWPPKSEVEKDGLTKEEWIKKNGCRADEDRASALKTALELGIPFKVLDFSEEYNKKVITYFYKEYEEGRTPNPDVLCNSEIKFGLFLDWALENGFDYIATGHYAKLTPDAELISYGHTSLLATDNLSTPAVDNYLDSRLKFSSSKNPSNFSLRSVAQRSGAQRKYQHLYIPEDKHKDQTYFLWKLTQKELQHVLFPLGNLLKTDVREIAKKEGLGVADKKDSQGICFVGNVDVREFLARRLIKKVGVVKSMDGEVLGEHDGVWFYTIGQRGGWRMNPESQSKWMSEGETPVFYIVKKKAENNELVVSVAEEAGTNEFLVSEVNRINEDWAGELEVRIRHGGELIRVVEFADNRVKLEKEVRGIASGQSAVFYRDGECLGGGVIA